MNLLSYAIGAKVGGSITISSDGVLHAVWADNRDGNWEIYYKHSLNNGETWESEKRITYNKNYSVYPIIKCENTILHLAWCEDRPGGKFNIWYTRSLNQGLIGSLLV
jgi:hypothetical protein